MTGSRLDPGFIVLSKGITMAKAQILAADNTGVESGFSPVETFAFCADRNPLVG